MGECPQAGLFTLLGALVKTPPARPLAVSGPGPEEEHRYRARDKSRY
jgi:hypothetical protein